MHPSRRTLVLAAAAAFAAALCPAAVALAEAPSKQQLVDILKVVDDRQRNSGDWRSLFYMEQKEKDIMTV